jgi:hypothetical protein
MHLMFIFIFEADAWALPRKTKEAEEWVSSHNKTLRMLSPLLTSDCCCNSYKTLTRRELEFLVLQISGISLQPNQG